MILLAAGDTLQAFSRAAAVFTITVFGMEVSAGVESYKALYQGQPAGVTVIYTAPGSTAAIVKSIIIINTDQSNDRDLFLYSNGSANGNLIASITIPPKGSATWEDGYGWKIVDRFGNLRSMAKGRSFLCKSLTADIVVPSSNAAFFLGPELQIPANFVQIGTTFGFDFFVSVAQGAVAQASPGQQWQLMWSPQGVSNAGSILALVSIITPATALAGGTAHVSGFVTFRNIGALGSAKAVMHVTDPRGTRNANGDSISRTAKTTAVVNVDTTLARSLCIQHKQAAVDAAIVNTYESGHFWMVSP